MAVVSTTMVPGVTISSLAGNSTSDIGVMESVAVANTTSRPTGAEEVGVCIPGKTECEFGLQNDMQVSKNC